MSGKCIWNNFIFFLFVIVLVVSPHAAISATASNGLIVKFKDSASKASQSHALATAGVRVVERFSLVSQLAFIQTVGGQSSSDSLRLLQNNPSVEYIEPDYLVSIKSIPTDPRFSEQYGLNNTGQTGGSVDADIDAPEAWDVVTGADTVVAVIDTGVDYTHEDLATNIWTNTKEVPGNGVDDDNNGYIDDVRGWNFANDSNDPMDVHGHGTHVAGIIAAQANNSIGVSGVNWRARIMPLKFIDQGGMGSTSNAIRAINYAVAMGARISNSSWGGAGYSRALFDTIDAAAKAGHLFVAASGNDGVNSDDPANLAHYPSSYDLPNIISVGASDNADNRAIFSNWGPIAVDLVAPGQKILSTIPSNRYEFLDGTSMAAPFVAGVAALLLERIPSLAVEKLRSAILDNVDNVPALAGVVATGGRLNASRAVNSLRADIRLVPNTAVLSLNSSQSFSAVGGSAPYTYELTNPSVGQINSSTGLLYATTVGRTQIKAIDANGFFGFSGDIQVVQISVMPLQAQIRVGETIQFVANGGTPPYSWSSANPSVGSINSATGQLAAVGPGQTQVTVQDINRVSATSGVITVIALPTMQLTPTTAALQPGDTLQFRVSGGTPPYRWNTSNPSIASIDSNGLMTAITSGVIKVSVSDSRNVSVTSGDIAIDGIFVVIGTSTLRINQSVNLSVQGGVPPYQWRVTNSSIATVDNNGVLTALKPGSIKVTIMDSLGRVGRSQTVYVTDNAQLSLFPQDKAIALNGSTMIKVTGGIAPYVWTSSQPSTLSVDPSTGTAIGISLGSAVISVNDASGQTASTPSIAVRSINLSPMTADIMVGASLQFNVSGGVAPYRWTTNSLSLATINDQGVLIAQGAGSIAVSVSDADGVTVRSGQINITTSVVGPNIIDIKPITATLSRKSTTALKFVATGGTAPYTFTSRNTAVGSINSVTGEFLPNVNNAGATSIIVTDLNGYTAESGTINVQ